MIAAHDLVLAISNSACATELNTIGCRASRFGIPLVAITRDPTSVSLARPPTPVCCCLTSPKPARSTWRR
jgi:D-arabinose 5-phosphate isomerase GutQ